jgi:hypothetical protein
MNMRAPKFVVLSAAAIFIFLSNSPVMADEQLQLITSIPFERDSSRLSVIAISPVGDYNADGNDDLVIGLRTEIYPPYFEGVYLFLGGPEFDSLADMHFFGDENNPDSCSPSLTGFGSQITGLGDFNGDAFDDFAISAFSLCINGTHEGRIYIYYGGPDADTSADFIIDGSPDSYLGSKLIGGNFDCDSYNDLLATNSRSSQRHCAVVFLGGTLPDIVTDWIYCQDLEAPLGRYVTGGFDPNGDGCDDIYWETSSLFIYLLFLGGDTISQVPIVLNRSYNFLNFDLTGDDIDDFWARGNNDDINLYFGGDPLNFAPDYPHVQYWFFPHVYHRTGHPDVLVVDESWVNQNYKFHMYTMNVPPDTIAYTELDYGFGRLLGDPNVRDINADGLDELALGYVPHPETLDHIVYIYQIVSIGTGIEDDGNPLPIGANISAFPNPFNAATTIILDGGGEAEIDIYDIAGRRVATLRAENGRAVWDAGELGSGVYFAQAAGEMATSIKLIYLK